MKQDAQTPASTTHSTPGSLAPTPLSTSFKDRGGDSGAPTPTSTTAAGKAATAKKAKKTIASKASGVAAVRAASAGVEDSETDSREAGTSKKVRTNFGASRK